MEGYLFIVIIFGIIILLMLICLFFVNKISLYRNRVELQFQPIKDILQSKLEILDDTITFIKESFEEEDSFIKELIQTKDLIKEVIEDNTKLDKLHIIEKNSLKFQDLSKVYSKLKKNKEFLSLTEELNQNHERIIYAIDSYDKEVQNYNTYLKKKYINILAKVFRFQEYESYNK